MFHYLKDPKSIMAKQKRKQSPQNLYVRVLYPLFKKLYMLIVCSGFFDWGIQQMTLDNCPNLAKLLIEGQISSWKIFKILFIDGISCADFKTKKSNTQLNTFIFNLRHHKIFNLRFFQDGNKQLRSERQFMRNMQKLFRPLMGLLVRVTLFGDKTLNEIGEVGTSLLKQIINDQEINLDDSIGNFTQFKLKQHLKPIFQSVNRTKYDYAYKIYKQQYGNKQNDSFDDPFGQVNFPSCWFQLGEANRFYKEGPTLKSKFETNKGSITVCQYIQQNRTCKAQSIDWNVQLLDHILQMLNKIEANNLHDDETTRKDGTKTIKRFSPSHVKRLIRRGNQMQQEQQSSNQNSESVSDSRGRQINPFLQQNEINIQDSFQLFDELSPFFPQQSQFYFFELLE